MFYVLNNKKYNVLINILNLQFKQKNKCKKIIQNSENNVIKEEKQDGCVERSL